MEMATCRFSTERFLLPHSASTQVSYKRETQVPFRHSGYLKCSHEGYNMKRPRMMKLFLRSTRRGCQYGASCCSSMSRTNHCEESQKGSLMGKYDVVRSDFSETTTPSNAQISGLTLNPRIRATCFFAISVLVAIFVVLPMIVAHPFVLLFDQHCRRFHHFVARFWAILTAALFCKFEYEGLENLPLPDTSAVYVSNHQSFLDIYALLTLSRNFKFISKTSIFLFPVVGWAMFMIGVIPLKRMDSRSQLECLKQCIHLVNKGTSVFFFPEGTRSRDGTLGAFKKGAFTVAAKTGAPVVPISLVGTGKIMPAGMENVMNYGSVKVIVHKPIKGTHAEELRDEARNAISSVLDSPE